MEDRKVKKGESSLKTHPPDMDSNPLVLHLGVCKFKLCTPLFYIGTTIRPMGSSVPSYFRKKWGSG